MFGNNYKEKYVKALANSTFQRGILLENIGKQLKMDGEHKYVHELKGICKGNLEEDIDVRHIFALLDRHKIDLTAKEKDQFIREMGSKYFTVNEFIKLAGLDRKLFSQSEDPKRINPIDKKNV